MGKLHELNELGQSIWFDYIKRSLITSGELQNLINQGVRGVTSNPTIFEKAIAGSNDYDDDLKRLARSGKSVDEIYEDLVLRDISQTADLFRPLYDRINGLDGYVSLEVSPKLAYDAEGTIKEAKRLFKILDKPNVMIKVPATDQGIEAFESLIAEGINVNVTLLFSVEKYIRIMEAYITGLEKYLAKGGDLKKVASVASFFVSRVDTAVDTLFDDICNTDLKGKIAIANAKVAFARFRAIFSGERWQRLAENGARVQRLLWASTGTKDPSYPDTLYVDELIGEHTVNTLPPATLSAYLDHGKISSTLRSGLDEAKSCISRMASLDIDLDAITQKLEEEGVGSFMKSFDSLMDSIANKREKAA
jgi:transaldolase